MASPKPGPRARKPWFIAPAVIAGVVAAILLVVLLRHEKAVPQKPVPPAAVEKPQPPPVPPAPPPLGRRDLIDAARTAGAALADTGALAPATKASDKGLTGREFTLRIAFGCNGLQIGAGPSQLMIGYDADNQSMTLTAQPNVWTGLALVQALPGKAGIDAVEGFWIPRPWSYSDACPPRVEYPAVATPTPATAQTLGLARFFSPSDSRVAQHADHPFTFTRKLPADDLSALNHGYALLLKGHIGSYKDGRAVHCWMEAADHHPICLFSVRFDHVAFEDATTGETLAEWNE